MNIKEEALKLAGDLEKGLYNLNNIDFEKSSAMIRRLVEELDKQGEPIAWATEDLEEIMSPKIRQAHIDHPQSCTHKFFPIALYATPQTKPLSDEEIDEVSKAIWERPWLEKHREFARAIEERHEIK